MKKLSAKPGILATIAAVIVVAGGCVAHELASPRPRVVPVEMPDPSSPPGGDYTTALGNRNAFADASPVLTADERRIFFFGNRLFNTNWTTAPGSVKAFDGLGPVFNRVSCSGCHTRDGRGRPPEPGEDFDSMLVRISIPGRAPDGGPKPHPAYGDQINDRAILGVPAEAKIDLKWQTVHGAYGDGTPYELQKPIVRVVDPAFGPLGDDLMTSPRVANQVYGLGLLEAVYQNDILKRADPDDRDGDGVSGRPNWVIDPETHEKVIGRFGWKANQATLRSQDTGAAFGDIGLSTSLHPGQNCMAAQTACAAAQTGGEPELSDEFLDKLVLYSRTLAVPARRNSHDPEVIAGGQLFAKIGCAACHSPTMKSGAMASPISLANQTFHPFTDLLLHDMGSGLADGRPDYEATGSEWRTPPLWGIGLIPDVNGHDRLLHDGRARGVAEAILWHGGEGEAARERFKELDAKERASLVAFVNSL
ncbi:MAG: c-type cytochrome [Parvibaculum sp.]|uniref:di-heme oxidoreductase family protein n=1 Tax=Parvibaculum sp. TaxID=2024848 RepID=UPI0025DD2BA3|nr:di-heme oxidoredictase family protein [Parvibaculum sp.]MCE9650456.1 c-type cytochrome [Parvibaculum sp.]